MRVDLAVPDHTTLSHVSVTPRARLPAFPPFPRERRRGYATIPKAAVGITAAGCAQAFDGRARMQEPVKVSPLEISQSGQALERNGTVNLSKKMHSQSSSRTFRAGQSSHEPTILTTAMRAWLICPCQRAKTTPAAVATTLEARAFCRQLWLRPHEHIFLLSTYRPLKDHYRTLFSSARITSRPRSRKMACHIFSRSVARLAEVLSIMVVHPSKTQEIYQVTGGGRSVHFALQYCTFSAPPTPRAISFPAGLD